MNISERRHVRTDVQRYRSMGTGNDAVSVTVATARQINGKVFEFVYGTHSRVTPSGLVTTTTVAVFELWADGSGESTRHVFA